MSAIEERIWEVRGRQTTYVMPTIVGVCVHQSLVFMLAIGYTG